VANDPTFETRLHAGSTILVKADLGIKRVCPSCGARFYDLQKRPIECPKCAFSFEPESLYKQRRPRQPEPVAAEPVRVVRDEDDEDAEVDGEVAEEVIEEEPVLIVADDEDDEAAAAAEEPTPEDAGMSVVEADADGTELEDIVEDADEDEADDTLLAEVEEDEEDVSGIIDADIKEDER
jgi:uncharacterized protein (TIGR02300 family)